MTDQQQYTDIFNNNGDTQTQLDELQQQLGERQAKANRLRSEVEMLEARGDDAESQRDSLGVVEEEVRVLQQRRGELQNLLEQPTNEELGIDPNLVVGGIAQVAQNGGPSLNLRTRPDLDDSGIIDRHPAGTQMTILYGPEEADGHIWWRVRRMDGLEGWVASDGLEGRPA